MVEITINLYKAKWCIYCQKFIPIWEMLKKLLTDNKKCLSENNLTVKMNCYEETNSSDNKIIREHNITSYPTIKFCINNTNSDTFCDASVRLEDSQREPSLFIETIFADYKKVKTCLLEKLNETQKLSAKKMSGGFFEYSKNPKYKYYKEYLKCRTNYLELKKIK